MHQFRNVVQDIFQAYSAISGRNQVQSLLRPLTYAQGYLEAAARYQDEVEKALETISYIPTVVSAF